ncbi:MAG TPA: glycosyltransferase family 4 protein [Candidatus Limnocylindrales bacterium]
MPSRAPKLTRLARLVIVDPAGTVNRIWTHKAHVLFRAAQVTPASIRRPLAAPVAGVAEALVRRPGAHRRLPQLAFVARWSTGDTAAAGQLARDLATSSHASPSARRRLAQLTYEAGLAAAARDIVDGAPDDRSAILESVRSRLAYDAGHYREAAKRASGASAAGSHDGGRLRELAEGRMRSLDPAWQPDPGPRVRQRLERLRGTAVKGRIAHIVFASPPYHQSGYDIRSQAVAHCQQAAGLDPRFITRAGFPRNQGVLGAPTEETIDGVPYYRIAPNFGSGGRQDLTILETIKQALPLLQRLRPAALQPASNHVQGQIALALGRPMGIPVVYEARGFWEETWASHPWHSLDEALATDHYTMTREIEAHVMRESDAVVTLSETMKAAIVERGVPADRIVVIPNAVDVEAFTPGPRDERLAAELGLEPGVPVVGYVSSLNAYEGIRYLLEAAAALRARGRALRVLIVGDGKDRAALEVRARELGLDDGTLLMPGRVAHDQVLGYYSLIDVFVVPRTADRVSQLVTPLKPFEAMALERAVVVSDLPALREIVQPGETGLTFRAEDAEDLATIIAGLLDDEALRRRLGQQAREWVLANRTWAANGRRYRELFEGLGAA